MIIVIVHCTYSDTKIRNRCSFIFSTAKKYRLHFNLTFSMIKQPDCELWVSQKGIHLILNKYYCYLLKKSIKYSKKTQPTVAHNKEQYSTTQVKHSNIPQLSRIHHYMLNRWQLQPCMYNLYTLYYIVIGQRIVYQIILIFFL